MTSQDYSIIPPGAASDEEHLINLNAESIHEMLDREYEHDQSIQEPTRDIWQVRIYPNRPWTALMHQRLVDAYFGDNKMVRGYLWTVHDTDEGQACLLLVIKFTSPVTARETKRLIKRVVGGRTFSTQILVWGASSLRFWYCSPEQMLIATDTSEVLRPTMWSLGLREYLEALQCFPGEVTNAGGIGFPRIPEGR